ncbi:MAG: glutamate 5-kinase [Myxococcota bacterium]
MGMDERRRDLVGARRVVVKVGTAVVSRPDGGLALGRIGQLVEDLHALRSEGRDVLLVTSGAVGLGAGRLGLTEPPERVVDRQACAAAGQVALMSMYATLLRQVGLSAAQVLVTQEDFLHRPRYLNVQATLQRLLELGAVPIINENDTVSTAELALRHNTVFGDNDRLSALVAAGLEAEVLLLLTSADGVFTAPPGEPGAERIGTYDPQAAVRFGAGSRWGRGGMQSKLAAAQVAVDCGTHVVIASGLRAGVIGRVLSGADEGTLFPAERRHNKKRQWLAFATSPVGHLQINAGARRALVAQHASLLAVGVQVVTGTFEAGAVVSIRGEQGDEIARGIATLSADEIRQAVAADSHSCTVVHRDHAVIVAMEEEG